MGAGCRYTMLNVQYRMHPDIAHCVNELFYDGNIANHPSTRSRPDARLFGSWARKKFHVAHNSVFIHVGGNQSLYRERRGGSSVSPKSAATVIYLIRTMRDEGITEDKIRVLTPYRGQLRLLRSIFPSRGLNVMVSTVDDSQGDEAPFVILDLAVQGGALYGGGFLKDVNRMNVALSRAKDGLVIVGHMTDEQRIYKGVDAWNFVIEHHRRGRWVANCDCPDGQIRERFQIPGNRYELTPRGQHIAYY